MLLSKLIGNKPVTLHTAVATLPMPTDGVSGGSLDSWLYDAPRTFRFDSAQIAITADGACTLAGPVGVYGGLGGVEYLLGVLNNGSDILIGGAGTGVAYLVHEVGIYDYLAIGGVNGANIVPSGGKHVTVVATPVNRTELP